MYDLVYVTQNVVTIYFFIYDHTEIPPLQQVDCGNRSASSCSDCELELGVDGCKGDCEWISAAKIQYCAKKIDWSQVSGK